MIERLEEIYNSIATFDNTINDQHLTKGILTGALIIHSISWESPNLNKNTPILYIRINCQRWMDKCDNDWTSITSNK